jgi:hypothetical protein
MNQDPQDSLIPFRQLRMPRHKFLAVYRVEC